MFASRSKVEELEERIEELERRVGDLEFAYDRYNFPDSSLSPLDLLDPRNPLWRTFPGSDVYDEGADYKGRRYSNDLNDMGLG